MSPEVPEADAPADPTRELETVGRSHDQLAALVAALHPADLSRRSYSSEWNLAQVLSHLGSQAEIFSLFLDAGLRGAEAPAQAMFGAVWDAWGSRSPSEVATDSVAADRSMIDLVAALSPHQLASFRLNLFGRVVGIADLLRMRLAEQAVHTWDIMVALDPAATIMPEAVDLLVDGLGDLAARAGVPAPRPATIAVTTTGPRRQFVLRTGGVSLEPGTVASPDGSIELPAEALVRLVYGRLDPARTHPVGARTRAVDLEALRAVFPGV